MTVYGGVAVYIHIFLTSALVGVNDQLHAPVTIPQGNEPPVHTGYEARWVPERSGRHTEEKILDPIGTRTPIIYGQNI
jgi:hypothetical protein